MAKKIWCQAVAAVLVFSLTSISYADNLNYGVVSLSANAAEMVQRDTMSVVLSIQESGADRQKVSNTVTERSNQVLQKLRQNKVLDGSISNRRVYPAYENNNRKTPVWHDIAEISVSSKDFAAMSKFLAAVQNEAAIGHLNFSVSKSERQKMQEKLITQAIHNFQQQAQVITRAMGRKDYKIINIDINGNRFHDYGVVRSAAPMMTKSMNAAEMEVESGESEVSVNVSGSIQVQ